MTPLTEAGLLNQALNCLHVGKVRRTYAIKKFPELLLLYVTDAISTHNVTHRSLIPQKGIVLNALTVYWLREVFPDIDHHLVASGREIYQYLPEPIMQAYPELHHRAVIVRKLDVTLIEFIYRRYLVGAGSLYKEYATGSDPYGLNLPPELPVMHRFTSPVFTPTDKSATDDPRNSSDVIRFFRQEATVTSRVFKRGEEHLAELDIALLDSKMEAAGEVIVDEILTPDSSRFANLADIREGRDPTWLDKEFVRAEVVRRWNGGDKIPLELSEKVVKKTGSIYRFILLRITGHDLESWITNERFDFHSTA